MLLIITNSLDATTDYLCEKLNSAKIDWIRFNTDHVLESALISYRQGLCTLSFADRILSPDDVSAVWLRRPKPIASRTGADHAERAHIEGEWSEALEGFFSQIAFERWINHPIANARASHKVEQLTRAEKFGLAIPRSIVTQSKEDMLQFWESCNGQVVTKPLSSGFLDREPWGETTLIYTSEVTADHFSRLQTLPLCPTLFQERVPKRLDVRICIVDSDIVSVGLRAFDHSGRQRLDVRRNNMVDVIHGQVEIPTAIATSLLTLMRSYNLRFAAIDMAIDQYGTWVFFELNPTGQWAWLDLVGVSSIATSLLAAFQSS